MPYMFNISIDLGFPDTFSDPEQRYPVENYGLIDFNWNE